MCLDDSELVGSMIRILLELGISHLLVTQHNIRDQGASARPQWSSECMRVPFSSL